MSKSEFGSFVSVMSAVTKYSSFGLVSSVLLINLSYSLGIILLNSLSWSVFFVLVQALTFLFPLIIILKVIEFFVS